jgi:hypothetical protein
MLRTLTIALVAATIAESAFAQNINGVEHQNIDRAEQWQRTGCPPRCETAPGRTGTTTAGGTSSTGQATTPANPGLMSPHHAMHAGRTDASQNGAVDRLNEQSLQAAQQGQNFTPGGSSAAPPSNSMGQGNMGQSGGGMSGQSGGRM